MALPLELPVLQRWGCSSCGACCRQHLVEITAEEKQRIDQQNWNSEPALAGSLPVVPMGKLGRLLGRWRLNHRPDGACVFLQDDGLCRIHATLGETAKPLACRVYPYAFHPAGRKVTVSLRYSCPSVVANVGPTAIQNGKTIRRIAQDVVPNQRRETPPPEISPGQRLTEPEFVRFLDALDATLSGSGDWVRNLLAAIFWVSLAGQAKFEQVRGPRLGEFLELIRHGAAGEVPVDLGEFDPPTPPGRTLFRLLVMQYARHDTAAVLDRPWIGRWRNLTAGLAFSRGNGNLPSLRPELRSVPFAALEQPFGVPPVAQELFPRYLRTKIRGRHFCGPAYYDVPFAEGFVALTLMIPVTLYLARWLAVSAGRDTVTDADLQAALAIADHHHGYSPALGLPTARGRTRMLARGDVAKLLVWYTR